MGKKKLRAKYTSKGIIGTNKKLSNVLRKERSELDNYANKFRGYLSGKPAYVTIDNPNPKETNKRRIRVSLRDLHGPVKEYMSGTRSK